MPKVWGTFFFYFTSRRRREIRSMPKSRGWSLPMVGRPTTTTTGGTSTATTTAMVLAFRELEIAYALKRVLDARQLISFQSGNMAVPWSYRSCYFIPGKQYSILTRSLALRISIERPSIPHQPALGRFLAVHYPLSFLLKNFFSRNS